MDEIQTLQHVLRFASEQKTKQNVKRKFFIHALNENHKEIYPRNSLRIPPPSGDFWENEGGGSLEKFCQKTKKSAPAAGFLC